jgi:hypothetical protein
VATTNAKLASLALETRIKKAHLSQTGFSNMRQTSRGSFSVSANYPKRYSLAHIKVKALTSGDFL